MSDAYDYPLILRQLLHSTLSTNAGQEIIYPGVMRYTYADWFRRLQRLANAFHGLGLGRGNVIAVMDWDSHRYFECFFGIPMIGATLHTVNVRLSPDQVLYTINHAEDDAILVHEDFLPLLAAIAPRITRPVRLILLSDRKGALPQVEGLSFAGEYEAMLEAAAPDFTFPDFDEGTRATLFYTTGTTGDPKGVSYSHRQIVLHSLGLVAALGAVPGQGGVNRADVYMPITPLFHVHAWGFPFTATMLGLKQIYPGRYEPGRLLKLIGDYGVTLSHCVPTILNMLLSAPGSEDVDLSRWKVIIGGSALPRGLAAAALKRGIDVQSGYGMSETCPILTISDMTEAQLAEDDAIDTRIATGRAVPMVELRVVDHEMRDMPRGSKATGEVVVRAPWLTEGYLKNPDGTASLWRGGYLHTGDVGYLEADGTLHITDRIKDVIKSGGEWISSLDLENLVSLAEGVAEVAAIGLPDAKWGERPCFVIALKPGADPRAVEAAVRHVVADAISQGHLSSWAAPDRVEFVDALPKTSVGKLDKKAMRAAYAAPSAVTSG